MKNSIREKIRKIKYKQFYSVSPDLVEKEIDSIFSLIREEVKELTADTINGDYSEAEKKNPLIAYNQALSDILKRLKENVH